MWPFIMSAALHLARHEDLFDLPENMVGEISDGELHTQARPAPVHAKANSGLGNKVGSTFRTAIGCCSALGAAMMKSALIPLRLFCCRWKGHCWIKEYAYFIAKKISKKASGRFSSSDNIWVFCSHIDESKIGSDIDQIFKKYQYKYSFSTANTNTSKPLSRISHGYNDRNKYDNANLYPSATLNE